MTFVLPKLPYERNSLEPYISAETLDYHYGKHHQTYVTNLNNLIADTEFSNQSLQDIIHTTANRSEYTGIFNNAAQVWNHTFYWNCLKPKGGGIPPASLKQKIEQHFNSFEEFKKQFKQAALTQFGSGWAWLVQRDDKLEIMKTSNADLPMAHDAKALLTCDVWEHAYYIDYRNQRVDYIDTFIEHLINWDYVMENLA